MQEYSITPLVEQDKPDWRRLFNGYADFYKTSLNEEVAEQVWQWLMDPDHVFEGLIMRDTDQQAIGIVHFRACPRSLSGGDIGFVDDIFIDPDARGSGAADLFVARLESIARERGWPLLRWVTQHFNDRGRAFYDRYTGGPSDFIMYQLKI
ncbi:MAG: GNAT family N-acetyltransferase [Saccharospirillum sp.]|nr:GNAT family N-acetyltransferase [Saccharospirillum sp.]